jgi:signal transduction histidine kinase
VAETASFHGGTVSVLESPLGGARVEVRLPRLQEGSEA